jgi:hypothetical protein
MNVLNYMKEEMEKSGVEIGENGIGHEPLKL